MPDNEPGSQDIDWRLTTFEGSRREQLRRWAQLPLEQMIAALEEMQGLQDMFSQSSPTEGAVGELGGDYDSETGTKTASYADRDSSRSGERGGKGRKIIHRRLSW